MSRNFKGSKYEATKGMTRAQIAKLFRADVKAAKKAGELPKELKLSVRTTNYSGGGSIDVTIKAVPASLQIANPERVLWDRENPHNSCHPSLTLRTPEAMELENKLSAMLDEYNYDRSDSMTDYFCVRFYGGVSYAHELEQASRDAVTDEQGRNAAAARYAREEAEMAEYLARKAAEEEKRKSEPKPKWMVDRDKPDPEHNAEGVTIWFEWSECGFVECKDRTFSSFAAANAYLKSIETLESAEMARIGRTWPDGSYRKTGFAIAIEGDTYRGRFDIGSDADTLEEHVLAFCDPERNPFLAHRGPNQTEAEHAEEIATCALWATRIKLAVAQEQAEELRDQLEEMDKVVTVRVPAVCFPGQAGLA